MEKPELNKPKDPLSVMKRGSFGWFATEERNGVASDALGIRIRLYKKKIAGTRNLFLPIQSVHRGRWKRIFTKSA